LLLSRHRERQDANPFDERFKIRRIAIDIISGKKRLVRDEDADSGIGEYVSLSTLALSTLALSTLALTLALSTLALTLSLLLINLHLRTRQSLTMKLIDGFAHLAQGFAQFLLLLPFDCYLDEGKYA